MIKHLIVYIVMLTYSVNYLMPNAYAVPVDNNTDLSMYQGCEPGPDVCVDADPQTRTIDGVSYTRPCWQYQQTWNCYTTQVNNSCSNIDMTGWYQIGDLITNPVYFQNNPQSFMTSWETMYGHDNQSCTGVDPSYGCGPVTNVSANVTNTITQNYDYQKICLLPPDQQPAACQPPDTSCTVINTQCMQTQSGVCTEEELTYQCGDGNPNCIGYDTGVALSDSAVDNGFNNAMASMAMAEMIANYSSVDASGNLEIFSGKDHVCHYWTDTAIDRVTLDAAVLTIVLTIFTAGGYAAAAGAVTAYGLSMLNTMKCCQSDPGRVITTNDFCTQEDIELAAARLKNRATRIDVNPENHGYATSSEHNCYCNWLNQRAQIEKTNVTDCRMDCVIGGHVIAVDSETWCQYPNIINKIVQEQGRQQLANMAAANVAGATTTTVSYPYFVTGNTGQWTAPVNANGHMVSFWQWPEACRDPNQQAEQTMSSVCPVDLNTTWIAQCQNTSINCGNPSLFNNPAVGDAGENWATFSLNITNTTPVIPVESVVVEDACDLAANNCTAQVHAWPPGGGQLHNTIPMRWSMRFNEPTGWSTYFNFQGPNGTIQIQPWVLNTVDPANPVPQIQYSIDGGASWQTAILPVSQPDMNYVLNPGATTEISVYGGCDNLTCEYYAAYNTTVQAKPWGYYTWYEAQSCALEVPIYNPLNGNCIAGEDWKTRVCDSRTGCVTSGTYCGCISRGHVTYNRQWHADCSGFSLEEMQLLDFGAMDFSEFTSSLVANPPQAQDLVSAALADSTTIQSTGAPLPANPFNTNDWTFKLEPSDPYPGTETTLRLKATYPIAGTNGTVEIANSYTIDWGDGSALQYVNPAWQQDETRVTHVYGGRANCAPTDTYCAPVPSVDTDYTIRVTFNTTMGNFTDTGIVRVSVTSAGGNNQNSPGATSHGTTVISPSQPLQ